MTPRSFLPILSGIIIGALVPADSIGWLFGVLLAVVVGWLVGVVHFMAQSANAGANANANAERAKAWRRMDV